jgi:hypothetical protein
VITPPIEQLAEVLRLVDAGKIPVPGHLADAAAYAVTNGLIDLHARALTDEGRRVLAIVGGASADDEEQFEHVTTCWTVGDLRRALAGVPDDTPIKVNVADGPWLRCAAATSGSLRSPNWWSATASNYASG